MRSIVSVFVATLAIAVLAPGNRAAAKGDACKKDVVKVCKKVAPFHGEVRKCLVEHASSISQGCQDELATDDGRRKKLHASCAKDANKVCHGVAHRSSRIVACLLAHKSKVSAACRGALPKVPGH
jgi:hypothetical protein